MFCLVFFLKLNGLFNYFRVLGILCKFLVAIFSQLFLGSFMDFIIVVAVGLLTLSFPEQDVLIFTNFSIIIFKDCFYLYFNSWNWGGGSPVKSTG